MNVGTTAGLQCYSGQSFVFGWLYGTIFKDPQDCLATPIKVKKSNSDFSIVRNSSKNSWIAFWLEAIISSNSRLRSDSTISRILTWAFKGRRKGKILLAAHQWISDFLENYPSFVGLNSLWVMINLPWNWLSWAISSWIMKREELDDVGLFI